MLEIQCHMIEDVGLIGNVSRPREMCNDCCASFFVHYVVQIEENILSLDKNTSDSLEERKRHTALI